MSKKSLIYSLIIGAVLTLSLGLYTLISAVIEYTTPKNSSVSVAYTSDQSISFDGYSVKSGNLELQFTGDSFLDLDAETQAYKVNPDAYTEGDEAGTALSFKAVATVDKHGSTKTYNVTVYKQGAGNEKDSYIVANAQNLVKLAEMSLDTASEVTAGAFYISQLEDVDISDTEWTGIGTDRNPYSGTYNGNGHTVKGMSIHVTTSNYAEYLDPTQDGSYTMALGFFTATNGATINGLNLEDASITIDSAVYSAISNSNYSGKIMWVRAGLLVGYVRNSVINGVISQEDVTDTCSTITGSISGFTISKGISLSGLGGVVGHIQDESDDSEGQTNVDPTNISGYDITASISDLETYTYAINNDLEYPTLSNIGGIIGSVNGHDNYTNIFNCQVTLTARTSYKTTAAVGGVGGYLYNTSVKNVTTKLDAKDNSISKTAFASLLTGTIDESSLSQVGGIAGYIELSEISNVNSDASIEIYSYTSAGVAVAYDSTLTNVSTSGSVIGYYTSGLAAVAGDCQITYTAETAADTVATNVTLYGWFNAGLVTLQENTSIEGNNAKVYSTINSYGKDVSMKYNNTSFSAGVSGYFYSTNSASSYSISNLNVNTTINNGVDMAGLVCYLGNNETAYQTQSTSVTNCTVVANLNSPVSSSASTTHKAAGAVCTIYGAAKLNNNNVTVNFNKSYTANKNYGVAMFGGLVSRVVGQNIEISSNAVSGSAYANYTYYAVGYGTQESGGNSFYQMFAGGLIGAITSIGEEVKAGSHATNDDGKTLDNVSAYDVSSLTITNNSVGVDITIDYIAQEYDNTAIDAEYGYKARAVGSLIGLIMNSGSTCTDLSSNTVSGKVTVADENTFTFKVQSGDSYVILSSMGYGNTQATSGKKTVADVVGITYSGVRAIGADSGNSGFKFPTLTTNASEE